MQYLINDDRYGPYLGNLNCNTLCLNPHEDTRLKGKGFLYPLARRKGRVDLTVVAI